MCKDHDALHYDPILRQVAGILAGGDAETRDGILSVATIDGLLNLCETEAHQIPGSVLLPAMKMLQRVTRRNLGKIDDLRHTLRSLWERAARAEDAADEIPF